MNLSLAQWRRTNIVKTIERTLQDCECDPRCLELEITERVFPIPDETDFLVGISYLRQLGVTISIDDFGTGHSNLGRLLELPVDRIKIDRSFIAGIGRPGNAEKITRSIIVLARSIGATVVAEGVERALQVEFLQSEGCDFGQGFYWAAPMSAENLVSWISKAHMKSVLSSCC